MNLSSPYLLLLLCFPALLYSQEIQPAVLGKRKLGHDWPQFLGPERNSKSQEVGLQLPWPKNGPRIVWQREVGTGYTIGSVAYGRLYQFDKYDTEATLLCLEAETGKELWRFAYRSTYEDLYGYNDGPRVAPLVEGNRVYIYGVEGILHCLQASDGKLLWKRNLNQEFGVVQNFFGVGSSPAIVGNHLIVMVGGSPAASHELPPGQLDRVVGNGSAIVAFDKFTGKVLYQLSDDLASYASIQTAKIKDKNWAFAFCRGGLLGFDPEQGKLAFHFPWRSQILESVNASTPIVVGNEILISETYGPGSALLKLKEGQPEVIWDDELRGRKKALQAHWNTPIVNEGYIYASSGRHTENAEMRCVEWSSGKVMWSVPDLTRCSLLYVDKHLISLGEYGELVVFRASSESFQPVSKWLPLNTEGRPLLKYPCWSAPILSHGLLYVRGNDSILCLDVIPEIK